METKILGFNCEINFYGIAVEKSTDYSGIVEKVNPHIKNWIHEETDGYQGDWISVGYDNTNWYYLDGSYGSCSGCDWLLSICSEDEAKEFIKAMQKLIKFLTKEDLIKYLEKEKQNCWSDKVKLIDKIIYELQEEGEE